MKKLFVTIFLAGVPMLSFGQNVGPSDIGGVVTGGLWSTSGDRAPWLMEGGKGAKPRAVHIQIRPDPLAR